jgi:flagellar basal body-associated protein FliL
MKDKHKLLIALVLLVVVVVLAISTLLKTPLIKGGNALSEEAESEIEQVQDEQAIDENT